MSLRELRHAVLAVDTFTMTEDELRHAHSAARAAAASVRPIPPAAKVVHHPVQPEIEMEDVEFYHQANSAERQPWSNSCSAFDIDESIMNQIDFSPHPIAYQDQVTGIAANPIPIPQKPIPIHVESFDSSPCSMESNSSNSSSSGDGDISLPPTPEFNPADKTSPALAPLSPRWDVGVRTKQIERPDLLHVNLTSTLPHVDATFSL
jgi:hypothetical protein